MLDDSESTKSRSPLKSNHLPRQTPPKTASSNIFSYPAYKRIDPRTNGNE